MSEHGFEPDETTCLRVACSEGPVNEADQYPETTVHNNGFMVAWSSSLHGCIVGLLGQSGVQREQKHAAENAAEFHVGVEFLARCLHDPQQPLVDR